MSASAGGGGKSSRYAGTARDWSTLDTRMDAEEQGGGRFSAQISPQALAQLKSKQNLDKGKKLFRDRLDKNINDAERHADELCKKLAQEEAGEDADADAQNSINYNWQGAAVSGNAEGAEPDLCYLDTAPQEFLRDFASMLRLRHTFCKRLLRDEWKGMRRVEALREFVRRNRQLLWAAHHWDDVFGEYRCVVPNDFDRYQEQLKAGKRVYGQIPHMFVCEGSKAMEKRGNFVGNRLLRKLNWDLQLVKRRQQAKQRRERKRKLRDANKDEEKSQGDKDASQKEVSLSKLELHLEEQDAEFQRRILNNLGALEFSPYLVVNMRNTQPPYTGIRDVAKPLENTDVSKLCKKCKNLERNSQCKPLYASPSESLLSSSFCSSSHCHHKSKASWGVPA